MPHALHRTLRISKPQKIKFTKSNGAYWSSTYMQKSVMTEDISMNKTKMLGISAREE